MSEEQVNEQVNEPAVADDWRAGLSEEVGKDPSLADIKDIDGLAKGFIHAQKMVGADKVVVPTKDATDEERAEFFNRLGRPEEAGGYEAPIENMPENTAINPETISNFFEEAHKIGLTKSQAAALVRWQAQQASSDAAGVETEVRDQQASAVEALQKEWGSAFEQNLDLAKAAVKRYGGQDLFDHLDETGLGNDPRLIMAFAKIGRAVSDDEIIGGGHGQSFLRSPAEAKIEIQAKMRDGEFMKAYGDRDHPGHKGAIQEMAKLHESAYPESDK